MIARSWGRGRETGQRMQSVVLRREAFGAAGGEKEKTALSAEGASLLDCYQLASLAGQGGQGKVSGDRLPVGAQLSRNSLPGFLKKPLLGLVTILVRHLLLLERSVEL